ncbi:MAG: asparagine synthase (glutamine-hydrolyzing) [Elusimicrobia bacterium]|nr:asparagine synthase (glutamine-hydrolyzing) [Elusimicrobiota bacterium]
MCGIAGIISLREPLDIREYDAVGRMTCVLRHRGPDDRGMKHDGRCAMGNARLKIIDLSDNARLPISDRENTVWLAYNGEVTNFRELKEQYGLERKYKLRSHSDAEVLVYLYRELGISFLGQLTGMFAFCIYDRSSQKVYLVRDFYGLRPLFYMIKDGLVYFASEIKSFLETDGFRDTMDMEGIYHYFTLAYIPGSHTPYADVKELRGGEMIEIDLAAGRYEKKRYHRTEYKPDYSAVLEETAGRMREFMLDSVRRNMISDVPVGMTFSGGVDTSCILALVKELGSCSEFHTFSVRMKEPSFDESRYQRLMVDFAKPVHHEIAIGPEDVLKNLVTHMAYLDEPHGDGAAIPFYALAEEAGKYVRVLLSGEGGDEVFNAYETHGALFVREHYRKYVPAPLRAGIAKLARLFPARYNKLSFDFLLKRFTEGAELGVPEAHIFWRHVLSDGEKTMLMPGYASYGSTSGIFRKYFDSLDFENDLDKISVLDMEYYFIDDLLVKNDRMVMAHSVEARYPFMDRPLVEFINRIPPEMRVRGFGFSRRYIEKTAMRDLLPAKILKRSNMGLEMPHSIWFLDSLKPVLEEYFTKENINRPGILDYGAVKYFQQQHMSGKKDYGRALWCILMFLIWFDLFVYNKDYKKYLGYA